MKQILNQYATGKMWIAALRESIQIGMLPASMGETTSFPPMPFKTTRETIPHVWR